MSGAKTPPHSLSEAPSDAARQQMTEALTAGEVAAQLGIKAGMVRLYALALEEVTGI